MKTLISLAILAVLVSAYMFSASLYEQGNLFGAYTLVMSSIVGLVAWIHQVKIFMQKSVALKMPSFKTLFSFVVLGAIVTVYLLSPSLYEEGYLLAAYSLVIGSILSFVFWIEDVSTRFQNQ